MHVVAGMGDRQRPPGLDQPGQVEALDILHRQDEALADPEGRVGGDDIRVMQPGRVADLGEEAIDRVAAVDQVTTDDLEHFHPPHEPVPGQVDHSHAAPAQLAGDLVIGMIGEPRGQRAGRGRCRRTVGSRGQHRQAGGRGHERAGRIGPALGLAEPFKGAIRRQIGDTSPTVGAGLEVIVDRLGRGVVEPAQTVGAQRLVGRVEVLGRLHRVGLLPRVWHRRRATNRSPIRVNHGCAHFLGYR